MTYSNYVNSGHVNASYANSIGYRNENSGGGAYGYYANGALSYTNYCNAKHPVPTAYNITASVSPFVQNQVVSSATVLAQIQNLKTDLVKLSTLKVAKNGNSTTPITYTPSFAHNIDSNFEVGDKLDNNQIEEMTQKVKQLWQSIKGEAGSGWPADPADNTPAQYTDYKTLIEKAQTLAQDTCVGYLNCCHHSGAASDYGYRAAGSFLGLTLEAGEPKAGAATPNSSTHKYGSSSTTTPVYPPSNLNGSPCLMAENSGCSVCGKDTKAVKLLIEVNLEIFPKYVSADGKLENMNGLWKKTREYFCEECFDKYATTLEKFYCDNQIK